MRACVRCERPERAVNRWNAAAIIACRRVKCNYERILLCVVRTNVCAAAVDVKVLMLRPHCGVYDRTRVTGYACKQSGFCDAVPVPVSRECGNGTAFACCRFCPRTTGAWQYAIST